MHRKQTVMQNPIPCLGSLERNSRTGLRAASIGSISLLAVGSGILKASGKPCRTATPAPLNTRRISHTKAHFRGWLLRILLDGAAFLLLERDAPRELPGARESWSWCFGKRTERI
jgi:hypothetical protein